MIVRIWVLFVIVFLGYSFTVYRYADANNTEGVPDRFISDGWSIWQSKNCQSCHQLYGLGGYLGPDLTNVASAPGKGPFYIDAFIRKGTAKMPDFHLNDTEIDHVKRFLTWIDKSGKSTVPQNQVHWSGTYNLDH